MRGGAMANAKGTTMLGAVRFLRHHRDRARELLRSDLHHYLDEQIRESKWYPEEDLLALIEVLLTLLPGPRDDVLAEMGAMTAREHLGGIYRHLSGGEQATPSPSQAFALWASQHDSGRLAVERLGPGEARMTLSGFGLPSEPMCKIFGGYFAELLRHEGARDVITTKEECVLKGAERCSWTVAGRTPPFGDAD